MNGLSQQASTLGKFPENVREVVCIAVIPIPRVSGKEMCSGLFHRTGVLAEGICATGLKRGGPAVFPLLELDGPSCKAMGEISSMDASPCASVEECHLFNHGDHLGSGLGEVVIGGCPSALGALVDGMDRSDDDGCPNKMW